MKLDSIINADYLKEQHKEFRNKEISVKLFEAYQLKLINDLYTGFDSYPVLLSEVRLPINNTGLDWLDEYDLVDLKIIRAFDKLSENEISKVNQDFINYLKRLSWKFTAIYIDDGSLVAMVDWSED